MSLSVRSYTKELYPVIVRWYMQHDEVPPTKDMLSEMSSFVVYEGDEPVMTLTLIITNIGLGWLENLIKKPNYPREKARPALQLVVDHAEKFAKSIGCKGMFCMGKDEKVMMIYESLGYHPTIKVQCFTKELK